MDAELSSFKNSPRSLSKPLQWAVAFGWARAAALVVLIALFFLDHSLRDLVRDHESTFLSHFFGTVKYAGNFFVGTGLALVLLAVGKYAGKPRLWRAGRLMLLSLVLTGLLVLICKPVLGIHPRAAFYSVTTPQTGEMRWGRFPSGDAAVAFSIIAALVAEFPQVAIPCFAVGLLVGVERVYFNLHFFSDIFAGAWLSIAMVGFLKRRFDSSPSSEI